MNNTERFKNIRRRVFRLIESELLADDYCKSYEGAIEISCEYPNYFEDEKGNSPPFVFVITLHCYVLGDCRHHRFEGKTFAEALDAFDARVASWEAMQREYEKLAAERFGW